MADTWRKPYCPDEDDWRCSHPDDYRDLENAWLERRSAADRFWRADDAAPFPIETIADVLCIQGIDTTPDRLMRDKRLTKTRISGGTCVLKRDFLAYLDAGRRKEREPEPLTSPRTEAQRAAESAKRALELTKRRA